MTRIPVRILIIAGSDSSGGAGLQTDIATARKFGVYPHTAVSCVTSQNSAGLRMAEPVSDDIFIDQIISCLEDFIPDAIKIGMLSSASQVEILTDIFSRYNCRNIVLDPLMLPTKIADAGNYREHDTECASMIKRPVFTEMWSNPSLLSSIAPFVTLVTPNIPELFKQLKTADRYGETNGETYRENEIHKCNDEIKKSLITDYMDLYGFRNVLLKGGHGSGNYLEDLLAENTGSGIRYTHFPHIRIDTPNTHGTGCTLSSAIASALASGATLPDAVRSGTDFITRTMTDNKNILFYPEGHGPTLIL